MKWKKVFLGGAVLVLAACGDATSPTSPSALTKLDRATANATKQALDTTTVTAPPLTTPTSTCSSALIRVGLDGELIVTCEPVLW